MNTELANQPAQFMSPDVWHLPATYWFWHRIPTFAEIDRQLDEMKQGGYGSFQIATRLSFPLEHYLSEAYLAACRYAADRASLLGMMIGVYDDYNWLSGHAGGKTVAGHDELRERHLFWSQSQLSASHPEYVECQISQIRSGDAEALLQPGMDWIYEQGKPGWDEWEVIGVYASATSGINSEAEIVDLTSHAQHIQATETGFSLRIPAAALPYGVATTVTLFVSARCFTSRMINYLLPEAAESFIRVGYEPYARAFGEHFGTTVKYMFYDQPHGCFYQWQQHSGPVKSSLMANSRLFEHLIEEHQGLAGPLMSLVDDIGPTTSKRRCEFFATYSELAISAFFGTLYRWCHDKQVLLSGHEVLGHVSSWDFSSKIITDDARCNFAMDYFAIDAFRDMTAVDSRNCEPQLAAKLGDSVARAHGRSGCIIEQYFARVTPGTHFAAGQWEVRLHDLRLQAIRHHLLGARQFLMHAFWLTDGSEQEEVFSNARFDFGPGINFQPWYSHHAAFAQDSGRLSQFLDVGQPYCDVALFYPLRTAWFEGVEGQYGPQGAHWSQWLSRSGYEYYFINEQDLLHNAHRDGQLIIGDCTYRALILPGIQVLASLATVEIFEQFVAQGGLLILSGELPQQSQAQGFDPELTRRIQNLIDQHDNCLYMPILPPDGAEVAELAKIKTRRTRLEYSPRNDMVWTRVTQQGNQEFLTVFNDSAEPLYAYLRLAKTSAIEEWVISSGEVTPLTAKADDAWPITIAPFDVRCFAVAATPCSQQQGLEEGWMFTDIQGNQRPINVDRGWEIQGLADYADIGRYSTEFTLAGSQDKRFELYLPCVYGSVEVLLNGQPIGKRGWPEFRFALPPELLLLSNQLTLIVAPSAANNYYANSRYQGPMLDACGLGAPPVIRILEDK